MGVGNTGDIDVLEKALTAENDIGPLRVSEDIDGMDFSFGEEIETEKGNLTEQIFDSWRSRMDVLELRIQLLGVLRKMALGEIGPGDVAAMVEASSASFLYLQNTKDNQSELSVESSNVTPPTFLSEWISEIPADIRVLEDEVMPVKCNLGPCREADRNAEKDMSSGGKVEADQGVTGELTPARCWRRINELRLRLELLENLRKMESGEFSGEEMQERSREVCTRWSGYDTEAAHWQALDEQQNPAQAFTGLQTAEDKEMNSGDDATC